MTDPQPSTNGSGDRSHSIGKPFYPLTAEIAAKLRRIPSLPAGAWRLWSYLTTFEPFGDQPKELPELSQILEECRISQATFYRAIAIFAENGLFDVHPTRMLVLNLYGQRIVSKMRKLSQNCESNSQKRENFSQNCEPSLYTDDQISHLYPPTTPERETEMDLFREWLRQRASALPNPPQFLEAWVDAQMGKEAFKREYQAYREALQRDKGVPPVPPDRFQIESGIIAAIQVGDRAYALERLRGLWNEGWHDLVEELCHLYPQWGYMVNCSGVEEYEP